MKKYLKFLKKEPLQSLELDDRENPLLRVNKKKLSIQYRQRGAETQTAAIRTKEPLSTTSIGAYFQVTLSLTHHSSQVSVGLINRDCAMKRHPGESNFSFGYRNNGQVFLNRQKVLVSEVYGDGHTIGVGINYNKQEFFITLNGKFKASIPYNHEHLWKKFYPCASVKKDSDVIKFNFGDNDFKYNYEKHIQMIEDQCSEQIEQCSFDLKDSYKLIKDYLKFHGHLKTLDMLESKAQIPEYKIKVHPFECPKSQKYISEKQSRKNSLIENGKEEELRQNEALEFGRHRSMSQYWNFMANQDIDEDLLAYSRRKSSLISQGQLINKDPIKKMEDEEEQEVEEDTIKFINSTRITILQLIRQAKIDEAKEILQKTLPQIFECYDYLEGLFLVFKFIQLLYEDGSLEAVKFVRSKNDSFTVLKKKKQLFPFYQKSQQTIELRPFEQLANLVTVKEEQKNTIINEMQFQAFAYFLNQFIMKFYGLYPESRLELIINHVKCINNKARLHHVGGPLFNV